MKSSPFQGTGLIFRGWVVLAVFLILPAVVQAQTASLTVGNAAGLAGTSVGIPVSFAPGGTPVSSLQFDLTFLSPLAYVSTTAGSAAIAAGKTVAGNAIPGGARVAVYGGVSGIGSGPVAIIQLTIAVGTPAGIIPIGITGISGSAPDATPVTVVGTGGSVTVNAPADTTPPTISSVAAGSITATTAVITWNTNEAADSQVEYGTTTAYGRSTTVDPALVTSHARSLSGLTANTTYHYRVRSKDAALNAAVSGDYTFTSTGSSDTTPPVITGVSESDVTTSSAIINWTTDEPADSQVEYGTSTDYGEQTALSSAMTSSHSQKVTGLTPKTLYHYRVLSKDAAGNRATSRDYTFTTSSGGPAIQESFYLPTFALGQNAYTGVALVNLDAGDADLTFTAFDPQGNLVEGNVVTNPATRQLKRGGQLPILDSQLFGTRPGSIGWMKVESTVSKVSSFFMSFDSSLTILDGANAATETMRAAILPEVGGSGPNRIYVANTSSGAVSVALSLMRSDGTARATVYKQVNANGELAADLYTELFPQAAVDPSDYLWISSSGAVVPYELVGEAGKDTRILSGQNTNAGATRLYSPQYVVGGPWRSTISLINLEYRPTTVVMHFVPDDPSKAGKTATFQIAAYGKLYLSDQETFLDPGTDLTNTITQGYVEIASDGARLVGSVTFGSSGKENFASALPLINQVSRNIVFSHTASDATYFTGVALLNPGSASALATIDLHSADGTLEATVTTRVPARSRKSQLLTEFFPSLIGKSQTSGYIRVTSDLPLASFALFGTNSLSVLSAIPAQPVQ